MKSIICLFSFLIFFTLGANAQSLENPLLTVLKRLTSASTEVGGAGNGGDLFSREISQKVNLKALHTELSDPSSFRSKYKLIAGDYNLCDGSTENCELSARYFQTYHTVVVNKANWNKLSNDQMEQDLALLVALIDQSP